MSDSQNPTFPVPAVSLVDNRPATTSIAIAEHFGKPHKNVLADIRNLLAVFVAKEVFLRIDNCLRHNP